MREWVKSHPPLLFGNDAEHYAPSEQFLFLELEYAHCCITELAHVSVTQYKALLFQLLYALHVAQSECKFVHNDLHLKNVLVQYAPPQTPHMALHHGEHVHYTGDYIVKITDFGVALVGAALF